MKRVMAGRPSRDSYPGPWVPRMGVGWWNSKNSSSAHDVEENEEQSKPDLASVVTLGSFYPCHRIKTGKRDRRAWLTEVVSGRQKVHCGGRFYSRITLGNLPRTWGGKLKCTAAVAGKRINRVLFPFGWTETKEIRVGRRKRTSQSRAGHQPIKSSDFIKYAAYPVFILKQGEPTKLITRWTRNR